MRSLPVIFSQKDPAWTQEQLGNVEGSTIGKYGCLLTSFAMSAEYYGKDTNPLKLNNLFKEKALYLSGNLLANNALSLLFPDVKLEESLDYTNIPADLTKLHLLLSDETILVILRIDMLNGTSHFALCVGCNGVVTIANSWTGQVENFSTQYGDPVIRITEFIVLSGVPAKSQQAIQDSLRLERDTNWNLYQDQLKVIESVQTQLKEAQTRGDILSQEVLNANATAQKLTTENAELNGKIANLLTDLAASHSKDKTAVEEGLAHQEANKVAVDIFQKIGEGVGLEGEHTMSHEFADAVIEAAKKGMSASQSAEVVAGEPVAKPKGRSLIQLFFNLFTYRK